MDNDTLDNLTGERLTPPNGYGDLLSWLKEAEVNVVTVTWIWRYRFAMWIVLPGPEMSGLRDEVAARLRRELSPIDRLSDNTGIGRRHPDTVVYGGATE